MKNRKRTILLILVVTLLSLTAITTYSRYTKTVSKTGTIATADVGYCKNKNITSFKECLIRNDSQQELTAALNTIDTRSSSVNFNNVEPIGSYIPKTTYTDITNKTNTSGITSTTANRFTYVVENKLITEFDVDDTDITKISFNSSTGYYTYTGSTTGDLNDIITTASDIENGVYKYTCLNDTENGNCTTLFLFTETPYLVSESYIFKQGYTYSYQVVGTSNSSPGLYKGEDDYTTYSGSTPTDNFTYYYRGSVKNNWVSFGGFLWRVVRINGDGTIRMIYSGLESAASHTGSSAQIKTAAFGDTSSKTATTTDITGLTSDTITTTYSNGRYGNTYVGYMYNPAKIISTYPDKIPGNTTTTRLNYFPTFANISNATNYYYFKNFDPSTDCFTGSGTDETGACTLKCRSLGNDGDSGIDCVQSNWNTLATTTGNYSTTGDGVYPASNPSQYAYTSDYKYTCWGYGTPVKKNNSDGTTSVYITCPIVSEIIGTVKNQPTQAKVKYHGLFSQDAATSNTNVKDSNIKIQVDNWYASNILNKNDGESHSLESYLSDGIFCNDRSSTSSDFPLENANSYTSYTYESYNRNSMANRIPSLKCPNISNDGFTLKTSGASSTVSAKGNGNNLLNYPVGLITIDEAAYAGGKSGSMNQNYYLYTGKSYWTMSPNYFSSSYVFAFVWDVNSTGFLSNYHTASEYGVRPVLNLKSDVLYSNGMGTESDPYIITIQ